MITLDTERKVLCVHNNYIGLSPRNLIICEVLFRRPGRVVAYESMFSLLWGDDVNGGPIDPRNRLAVNIWRLHKRIYLFEPRKVICVRWGTGYYIDTTVTEKITCPNSVNQVL